MDDEATAISIPGEVDLPVVGLVRGPLHQRGIGITAMRVVRLEVGIRVVRSEAAIRVVRSEAGIRVVHSEAAIATSREVAEAAPVTTDKGGPGPARPLPPILHGPNPGVQLLAGLLKFRPLPGVAQSREADQEARQGNLPASDPDPHNVVLAVRGPRTGVDGARGLDPPGLDLSLDLLLGPGPGPGRPTVDPRR